jgi:hypothetical protein
MQYAPPISTNIGTILANAGGNAADSYMQGMKQFSEGIGDGISSAGSSIAGGITKAGETRIASDGVNAKFDMLKGIKKSDGSNLISQDTIDKFDTMPLGKRQGIVSTADSLMDYDLKQWMYGVQYNAQNNRLTQAQLQNQVPANQQPYTPPAQQANPAGNINMNFVTQPQQQQ